MISAKKITKRMGNKLLFEKINFEVKEGDLTFIQGKSGSGKSVFLRCLTLLVPVDEGEIHFNPQLRENIFKLRSQVHYLRQDFAPILSTVEDEFKEAFKLNIYKGIVPRDINWYLEKFELNKSFLKKKAQLLSGGERQILHLVRSFCLSPKILLLDEPTSAMDPQTKRVAEQLISEFKDSGGGVVWVTHETPPLKGSVFRFPKMEIM